MFAVWRLDATHVCHTLVCGARNPDGKVAESRNAGAAVTLHGPSNRLQMSMVRLSASAEDILACSGFVNFAAVSANPMIGTVNTSVPTVSASRWRLSSAGALCVRTFIGSSPYRAGNCADRRIKFLHTSTSEPVLFGCRYRLARLLCRGPVRANSQRSDGQLIQTASSTYLIVLTICWTTVHCYRLPRNREN